MPAISLLIQHYPYPYKIFAVFVTALILILASIPFYGIYILIIRQMTKKGKEIFHRILIGTGIFLLVVFFVQINLALINENQVNKQMGFSYATPETPEGEFFIITKVVPGGTMAKAGLKPEDRVLMDSIGKLYKLLIKNQGKTAEFKVLRNEIEFTIRSEVPEMKLPLKSLTVWF